ncbi:hypothetical protein PCAR4_20005 [Paraburkholderia caribensis]|nr:hypothetical protein PCAR4_20005 [Paraburkholderia caribensis]
MRRCVTRNAPLGFAPERQRHAKPAIGGSDDFAAVFGGVGETDEINHEIDSFFVVRTCY